MRLKYYLRGLGIGIILTTLILTVSRVNHRLSDQQIINRAMELGMVMKEDPEGNLDEVLKNKGAQNSDPSKGDNTPDEEQTPEAAPSGTPEQDLPEAEEQDTQAEGTDRPEESNQTDATATTSGQPKDSQAGNTTGELSRETTDTTDTTQTSQKQGTGETDTGTAEDALTASEEITFTIEKGMSSGKVAALLEAKGLIEKAEDFNNYIIQEDKSGVIRVGTFTVTKGTSYQILLKTITER